MGIRRDTGAARRRRERKHRRDVKGGGLGARDRMSKNVFTVRPETPLAGANALMRERKIRHLPVVDRGDVLRPAQRRARVHDRRSAGADAQHDGLAQRPAARERLHDSGDHAVPGSDAARDRHRRRRQAVALGGRHPEDAARAEPQRSFSPGMT